MSGHSKKLKYSITAGIFLFILVSLPLIYKLITRPESSAPFPYILYNSTLHFEPESGVIEDITSPYRVSITVNPGGEAINAASVIINYDPRMIEITEIDTRQSFCGQEFFLEKSIDNRNGRVNITCIAPGQGWNSPAPAPVAALLIKPLRNGVFTLKFDHETQILAHDGLGTNVLRMAQDGGYTVAAAARKNVLDAEPVPVLVFSPSHPNSERWYNNAAVKLLWDQDEDAPEGEYVYRLDQNPETAPALTDAETSARQIAVNLDRDGIYYFHIARKQQNRIGPVAHLKIMADVTPPLAPVVQASLRDAAINQTVRLEFSSHDEVSGLQSRYFYVKIDGGVFFPTASPLYTAFAKPGTHTITIRAFDNAGNYRDASVNISVKRRLFFGRF